MADTLLRPLDLGWHTKRADVAAGFQLYLPTGRYQPGGSDNLGKGMWTYEPFIGTTVYFDEKRSVSLAATAYWEFHGKKEDSDVRVGQILSLQGGLGKSYMGGGLIVGAAYYAQWKLTADELREFVLPGGTNLPSMLATSIGSLPSVRTSRCRWRASRSSSPWSTSAICGKPARG